MLETKLQYVNDWELVSVGLKEEDSSSTVAVNS